MTGAEFVICIVKGISVVCIILLIAIGVSLAIVNIIKGEDK